MSTTAQLQRDRSEYYSVEAEQSLLGSLLSDPAAWNQAVGVIVQGDFYRPDHQLIFGAISALAVSGRPTDAVTVSDHLERSGKLEKAGGLAYLGKIVRETPSTTNVGAYVDVVSEYARLRRLQSIGPNIEQAISEGATALQIVEGLRPILDVFTRSAAPKSRLTTLDFAQMRPHIDDGYLIKGLFHRATLIAVNGVSGSGKTFFATDVAMYLAAGKPWRGLRVQGGTVVYAALEGPASAENRFVAGRLNGNFPEAVPLRLTPGPVNLRDPADVSDLITVVTQAASDFSQPCVAVFVDTLSRAMSGGDENGPEDMGALIRGADAVRLATGAAVFLVHHLGKDESRGGRGHSSLKGALDTEIEVSAKDGLHVAAVTKQRDLASGTQYAYRLKVTELGRDEDGDPVTTCIVDPVSDFQAPSTRKELKGENQQKLLAALQEWKRQNLGSELISSADLTAMAKGQGINRQRRQEVIEKLVEYEWLSKVAGGYRFNSEDPT
jgi:AAA domain/DnaB-like helicase N terminal domain